MNEIKSLSTVNNCSALVISAKVTARSCNANPKPGNPFLRVFTLLQNKLP